MRAMSKENHDLEGVYHFWRFGKVGALAPRDELILLYRLVMIVHLNADGGNINVFCDWNDQGC